MRLCMHKEAEPVLRLLHHFLQIHHPLGTLPVENIYNKDINEKK